MFRIHRVYDDTTSTNRELLRQVQEILRAQFPNLSAADVGAMTTQVRDPLYHRFKTTLFVAEQQSLVHGFAVLLHMSDLDCCFLDFISTGVGKSGSGIGGALYERVRDEAAELGARGLFLECLPDGPPLETTPKRQRENAARLKFYERYGARPIINNAYDTPWPEDDDPYWLVFDSLGNDTQDSDGVSRAQICERLPQRVRPQGTQLVCRRPDAVAPTTLRHQTGINAGPALAETKRHCHGD